ncbi:hypothetical protein D3C81_2301600 [compost metagenome]
MPCNRLPTGVSRVSSRVRLATLLASTCCRLMERLLALLWLTASRLPWGNARLLLA